MNAEAGVTVEAGARLKIFLSYARADQAWARRLIDALHPAGREPRFEIWWDALLEGGENFLPTTEAALTGADAVVVLWSRTSIDSHWVRDEATSGRDRRRLVPISIDGSMAPLGFRQFQLIDMATWNGAPDADAVEKVIRAILAVAGVPEPAPVLPTPSVPPAPRRPQVNRRLLLAGGGAVLLAAAGLAGWQFRGGGDDAERAVTPGSIAVLPFRNLSGDPGQTYLAEGLAEELRTTLSLNRQLRVSGQTSSAGFRDADGDLRSVASTLGVAHVLTGSMRRAGNVVRVSARLVDGATGFETWTQSFERGADDLLAVEAEIATKVTDALIAMLGSDPDWRARRPGGTSNAAAFDAYLKGQSLYQSAAGASSDQQALAAFDAAIAADPAYAAAHAARARVLMFIANSQADGPARNSDLALAAARRAINLAPDMPEGHAALGFILMSRLDLAAARAPHMRSMELGFGNAAILAGYAEYAANMGEFAAARGAMERALGLDPLNAAMFRSAAIVEYAAHDWPAAAKQLRTALSLNSGIGSAHRMLGDIALIGGDVAGAAAAYRQEPSKLGRLRSLAIAEARLSGPAAGEARLAEMVAAFGNNSLYQQAQVLAQWGRRDAALAMLERALANGDAGLALAGHDPMLDPIRQDGRFAAILARLGWAPSRA